MIEQRVAIVSPDQNGVTQHLAAALNDPDRVTIGPEAPGAAESSTVVFVDVLQETTARSIAAFPGRPYLVPLLRDEAAARSRTVEEAIHRARALLFQDADEAELAVSLYGPGVLHKARIIGTNGLPGLRSALDLEDRAVVQARGKRIDQVVESIDVGDATGQCIINTRNRLRALGYESEVHARIVRPSCTDFAHPFSPGGLAGADAFIYHHCVGSPIFEEVVTSSARKALFYHNITPTRFFTPYSQATASVLDQGRDQLQRAARTFDLFAAASSFNARELSEIGAQAVRTISPVTDFRHFDVIPRYDSAALRRPGTRWLFVGRIAPNKELQWLIEAFEAYLTIDEDATLTIVGKYDQDEAYYNEVAYFVFEHCLDAHVEFTGYADDAALAGYYRSADVFVTLSRHEGFCVPLVEAMFFDVPIIALAETAIPETLQDAGLLVEPHADIHEIAALANEVCTDPDLRAQVIAAQRSRRKAFLPERIYPLIDELANELV